MKNLAVLLILAAAANAQMSFPAMQSMTQMQGDAQGNMWGTLTVRGRVPVPPLLGAPFSGEETRTSVQVLGDGTRIAPPPLPSAKVARDAQGRTWMERSMGSGRPGGPAVKALTLVEIDDPVDGYSYILDPARKIAYRIKYKPLPGRTVQRNPTPTGVQVNGKLLPSGAQVPQVTIESMGTTYIQGVLAEGRRQTTVTPIGMRGNDRPMTDVNESWTVPSLQITILTKQKGPSGESSYQVANLSTLNPPLELFRPPAGYEVLDRPEAFTVEIGVRGSGAAVRSGYSGNFPADPTAQGIQR